MGNVGIGTTNPDNRLSIVDSNAYGTDLFSVSNLNSVGRANFHLANDKGYYVAVQMSGSTFSQPSLYNQAAIFSQGAGVSAFWIATNGETPTGGTTPIAFVAGGFSNAPSVYIAGKPWQRRHRDD
jgi:hypothetical protein